MGGDQGNKFPSPWDRSPDRILLYDDVDLYDNLDRADPYNQFDLFVDRIDHNEQNMVLAENALEDHIHLLRL